MDHSLVQIGLRVPDLDASVEHTVAVLGVDVAHGDGESEAMLALPERSPCLVLRADEAAALDYVAFVTEEKNLAEIARRASAAGIAVHPGHDGGEIRLYAPNHLAVEFAVGEREQRNMQPREQGPVIGSLDHVTLSAEDHDGTVAFFIDILGFRLSDSVGDLRHWLRCGPNHHTIAVSNGPNALRHYAFETDDLIQLGRLGDLLAYRGQNFIWGPGRHGLGANIFTYHQDPSGAVLEVTCDMAQVLDESSWVTQVWPTDTTASAVMWGAMPGPEYRKLGTPIYDHQRVHRAV